MTEPDSQTPLDQALEWCVRLQDAGVSEAEREAFARWLGADRRHPPAWQRAQQVWQASGAAGQAYVATRSVPRRRSSRRRWVSLASAAAVLMAVAVFTLSPARWADYRTEVAQVRSWTLEDGSIVQLAPQSALDVRFSEGERRIYLYRGEAWFKVASNPARPFVVEAAQGSVRALGTAFDVRLAGDGAEVTVTEHAVRVSQAGQQAEAREGQALHYDARGVGPLRSVDLGQQLAWREQRLAFRDEPLAQVLERLQPYSRAQLLLSDASLGQLRVTAAVQAREVDAALQSLQVILPIRVTRIGPWLTLVRARAQ
ncbi:FecR family protein [Pseudomonas rubra]|uniref:FecR domain-containing protein n=1 Tax=Pseudomonas rubra TaxID=2942627 RepID=A0ABT5PAI3_9PSED|nr:FecR domain-containing protein [Pseudomonas rubra]MDD1014959.1 FecR domain-containing protein [Pseudomonas rubra]MDD1038080.1 FecR domain-containing protein [Pseudomonas rubra]MDD1156593.1 FecR domain-containing protein [Pseudomonas rubra]